MPTTAAASRRASAASTRRARASPRASTANAREASIAGSWIDSGGFPTRSGDTVDRGFENTSFTASVRARARTGRRSGFAPGTPTGTSEYSDFFIAPVDQDFENSALALSADFAPTGNWTSRFMLGHAVDDLDQNQSTDFLDTKRNTIDWQNDFEIAGDGTLTAGFLWQDEEADASPSARPTAPTTTTSQFYLQEPGRVRSAPRCLLGAAYTGSRNLRRPRNVECRIRLQLSPAARSSRFRPARAFRAPDATDLYGFGGNPDLNPEESTSYEVSYRQPIGERQSFFAHGLSQRHRRPDRLLRDRPRYLRGREPERRTGTHRRASRPPGTTTGERWARARGGDAAGSRATGRPTSGSCAARAKTTRQRLPAASGRAKLAFDVLYAGEAARLRLSGPDDAAERTGCANLSARVALGERFTLLLRAENLFDEDYELASGFNTMGQSFFGALRYEFR